MNIIYRIYKSPVGDLKIASHNDQLVMCDWVNRKNRSTVDNRLEKLLKTTFEEGSTKVIELTVAQIEEYLNKERKEFDIPIKLVGTEFQKKVWLALLNVKYGSTVSYKDLAILMSNEKGVRAVANANGANSISIIIPCHRIIGSNGSLTGYAGGLEVKQELLKLEYYSQLRRNSDLNRL